MTDFQRLKEYFTENHITQKVIAKKMDMSPQQFNNILNGTDNLSMSFIRKLATILPDIDWQYVITGQRKSIAEADKEKVESIANAVAEKLVEYKKKKRNN